MIDRLKVSISSKPWFWRLRNWLGQLRFSFDRIAYKSSALATKARASAHIFSSITWVGIKSLFWVILALTALTLSEEYIRGAFTWLSPLVADDKMFIIDQLKLYAQLLTTIFSIYFATIGIILSAGYTRLRRDIIQMLINEQVGSVYARLLVLSAMLCLAATALPLFGFEPGLFVYAIGTTLTLLSALALFPLGQRLFNFFDLNLLVRSEVLPKIARHIEHAATSRNSPSLANHHSRAAQRGLEQLSYIDDRVRADEERLEDTLPALSADFAALLLHYLKQKHRIDQRSYWFPRRRKYKQWFFAGDTETSMALTTSNQQLLLDEKPDYQWLENEIVERLAAHVDLALHVGNLSLALTLITRFSRRIPAYARQFQFDVGMQEIQRFRELIEQAFKSEDAVGDDETARNKIVMADAWAALGSSLCLESLRRIITFENELEEFFVADVWSETSLRRLPAFLQVELSFIVERINFERQVEGQRLSKPKYVQQLAVKRLLEHYSRVLPVVCEFYTKTTLEFVNFMAKAKMSEVAAQVALSSLHSYWKLPGWMEEVGQVLERYREYEHYSEDRYTLPEINTFEMSRKLASARDDVVAMLGRADIVGHVFEREHDDELPDHFGQIYFELGEACIKALEKNDEGALDKVLPMFLSLAFLAADWKFSDKSLDITDEFRLHLISTVINDLASVLGFSILYAGYFENQRLSKGALARFDKWVGRATDKQQYLRRMVILSNPHSFSISASPRELIRMNWKMSFERRARDDGFGDQMGGTRGTPHPNKIVREFLRSHSDASHLFFAERIVPQLTSTDFDIDHHITTLARRIQEEEDGGQRED